MRGAGEGGCARSASRGGPPSLTSLTVDLLCCIRTVTLMSGLHDDDDDDDGALTSRGPPRGC
eukprot:1223229-Pyramimonas_sp.AAC.1